MYRIQEANMNMAVFSMRAKGKKWIYRADAAKTGPDGENHDGLDRKRTVQPTLER